MSIIVNGIELTEVIYAGVNLDIVKVKKGTAEAVTVFEKITQLATPQNVTANGTVVSWDEVENATSYEVLADGASIGTVENVTEDALAGTWVFNQNPDVSGSGTIAVSIKFTSNQLNFTNMLIIKGSMPSGAIQYGEYEVYNLMIGWDNEAYKTITITSKLSEVSNGDALLAWLQANATKQ